MQEANPRQNRLERWRERIRPYYLRSVYFRLAPSAKPAEFSRCWQAPHEFRGEPPKLEIPPPNPDLPDLVLLPMTDWHHRLQRSQHLAIHMAAPERRCFLLNPHLGREYAATPWKPRPPALAQLAERIFEIHAPLDREPVFHHRLLTASESRAGFEAIDWALCRAGARQVDVLFALPTWKDVASLVKAQWGGAAVYDCHDWLAGFPNMAAEIAEAEPDAMRAADAVVFSAAALKDKFCHAIQDLEPRAAVIRNGSPDWPEVVRARPKAPIVGYVGALEEWFWADAVAQAARAMPQVRFVLVGSAPGRLRNGFSHLSNVEFPGEVPHQKLPEWLARFRVGLIPLQGPLIPFTDPIKIYEYFHFGLPAVTGRMPELDRFGRLVYQAATPDEFVGALRQALEEDDPALEEARRREARAASWSCRAEQLEAVLAAARHRLRAQL